MLVRSILLCVVAATGLGAQSPLCTPFNSNVAGQVGWTVFFDLTVTAPGGVFVTSLDLNTSVTGAPASIDLYLTTVGGSYLGNETNPSVWTLTASGSGTAMGTDVATPIDTPDFFLAAGRYGVAVHHLDIPPLYESLAAPASTSNLELRMDAGSVITSAAAAPFLGSLYTPRQFNGCIHYRNAIGVIANFSASTTTPGPNEVVSFTDLSFSSDPRGIAAWAWDFDGDGATDATTPNPTWTYTTCGPRDVSLTVFDATGSDNETKRGYVQVGPPIADFNYSPPRGVAPLLVNFTDTSRGSPTSWAWDFESDGIVDWSQQTPPPWPFIQVGLFPVTLTVSNACGSDSVTKLVDTREVLCTTFAFNNGGGVGNTVYFDVNVTNPLGITINSFEISTQALAGVQVAIDVYCKTGSYTGSELRAADWSQVTIGATGTSEGRGIQTTIDVPDFCLSAGTYGFALVNTVGAGQVYTNGNGLNQSYSDANLSLTLGAATNAAFTGPVFSPRVWNGCIGYAVGVTSGSFTFFGPGCPNSTGRIATLATRGGALPAVNSQLVLEVGDAPPSSPIAGIIVSFVPLAPPNGVDLGIIGAPGCAIRTLATVTLGLQIDPTGFGSASLVIPHSAFGIPFFAEAILADFGFNPLGIVVSDTYQGLVGCN